jgi:hypothetical protein
MNTTRCAWPNTCNYCLTDVVICVTVTFMLLVSASNSHRKQFNWKIIHVTRLHMVYIIAIVSL